MRLRAVGSPGRASGYHAAVRPRMSLAFVAGILATTVAGGAVAGADGFDLQGHRGARGLAPENTLAAFRKALELGVTTLELDLAMTRDGVLVVSHDPLLNPDLVRDASGQWLTAPGPAINTLTLAELRRYDVGRIDPRSRYATQLPEQVARDGERIPTLKEVVDLVRSSGKNVRFNIETKLSPDRPAEAPPPDVFARAAVEFWRAEKLETVAAVQSFDWRTLIEVKRLAPDIETACLTVQQPSFDNVQKGRAGPSPWTGGLDVDDVTGSVPRLVQRAGCAIWSPFYRELTSEGLGEAVALGLTVIPWTVNEKAEMARLIDLGVHGIITDYPDRLRDVMAGKKVPLR
jgi:glycerophosphoryl diester phosphodiesterase